jgi:hypothetical protein
MPPPALDQRREGILRDVLREASAPSPGPRVGQQPRRQRARDYFKVHTGNVPEGSIGNRQSRVPDDLDGWRGLFRARAGATSSLCGRFVA